MATKRMTKKSVATPEEQQAVQDVKPKKTAAAKVEKKKKEFKETDGILCRSVTPGGLFMIGKKTGMKYEWNEYGREYEVEYRDLVIAVRTRSDFVFGPLFIIEDEDFIEEFQIVKKFYEDSYKNQDLEAILYMPIDEMKDAIVALPPRASRNFQSIASSAVRDKSLDSLEKIRFLDEYYNIDLKLLAEM